MGEWNHEIALILFILSKSKPMLSQLHPTTRFSNRVENYVKYRPCYPDAIVPYLERTIELKKDHRIADIGSGTGLFSELFLKQGYKVIGVEPNADMRRASEQRLANYIGFTSKAHQAEQTGFRNHSIDLITVGQAFHWMEPEATKKEFFRILKPGGHVILAWNLRLKNSSFLKAYHDLKEEFAIEHQHIQHVDEVAIEQFFSPLEFEVVRFENRQVLDFDGLKGQLLSASYIPLPGHEKYEAMITRLAELFVAHNEKGLVRMDFETKIFINK